MRSIRLYQDESLEVGQSIVFNKRNVHYLSKVLRVTTGELILFNGNGYEYHCELSSAHTELSALIVSSTASTCEAKTRIVLMQAVAKNDKMDLIAQKATELGVSDVIPFISQRVMVKLGHKAEKKQSHWQEIAINASEQCGRASIPKVHGLHDITQLDFTEYEHVFVLDPKAHSSLREYHATLATPKSIAGIIGPEGGLTAEEITQFIERGCKPLSLGPRVLRVETASLALLSAIELLYG